MKTTAQISEITIKCPACDALASKATEFSWIFNPARNCLEFKLHFCNSCGAEFEPTIHLDEFKGGV